MCAFVLTPTLLHANTRRQWFLLKSFYLSILSCTLAVRSIKLVKLNVLSSKTPLIIIHIDPHYLDRPCKTTTTRTKANKYKNDHYHPECQGPAYLPLVTLEWLFFLQQNSSPLSYTHTYTLQFLKWSTFCGCVKNWSGRMNPPPPFSYTATSIVVEEEQQQNDYMPSNRTRVNQVNKLSFTASAMMLTQGWSENSIFLALITIPHCSDYSCDTPGLYKFSTTIAKATSIADTSHIFLPQFSHRLQRNDQMKNHSSKSIHSRQNSTRMIIISSSLYQLQ